MKTQSKPNATLQSPSPSCTDILKNLTQTKWLKAKAIQSRYPEPQASSFDKNLGMEEQRTEENHLDEWKREKGQCPGICWFDKHAKKMMLHI